jgi:hypothetical protein
VRTVKGTSGTLANVTHPARELVGGRIVPALLAGISIAVLVATRSAVIGGDAQAYWQAAMRLREGADLYPTMAGQDASDVYRYAPWFAIAWVPLTFLPREAVEAVWLGVLVVAATYALLNAQVMLAASLAPFLVWSALSGNVHALMIAALVYGVDRRSGPIWIGISASLKITPILFALVYVGRRQWRPALLALVVGVLLWLPAVAFDLSYFPRGPGSTLSILSRFGILPYLSLGVLAIVLALVRPSWLSAAIAVLVWLPRLLLYDLSYLLVGSRRTSDGHRARREVESEGVRSA